MGIIAVLYDKSWIVLKYHISFECISYMIERKENLQKRRKLLTISMIKLDVNCTESQMKSKRIQNACIFFAGCIQVHSCVCNMFYIFLELKEFNRDVKVEVEKSSLHF